MIVNMVFDKCFNFLLKFGGTSITRTVAKIESLTLATVHSFMTSSLLQLMDFIAHSNV